MDDERTDVHLGDFGQVVGKLGDAQQDVLERGHVRRWTSPVPEQQRRTAEGTDQFRRVPVGER